MFSPEGAKASLLKLNPGANIEKALAPLDRDRNRLLSRILPPPGGILVALHNNSRGYSMKDEIPISEKVSQKGKYFPYEFLLTTSPADYERIAQTDFNYVLQQNPPPPHDGSLSRLCAAARSATSYRGGSQKLRRATGMLQWLLDHLTINASTSK